MRPTEHGFVGPLAGELEEYIRFKASMGRHGATRVRVLRSFDRHCLEHGAVRLERGVVERWIAHRIDANPGGCRSWFSYIRDFGRWMRLAHDPDAYVLSDQWKAGSPRPTPYLLTDREAALFLRAAGTLESPSPWAWQSRAFFMLMACCGLRTREVRRLAVGHVDHKARSIDVVDSKAGRSRRLPVGDEVAAETIRLCLPHWNGEPLRSPLPAPLVPAVFAAETANSADETPSLAAAERPANMKDLEREHILKVLREVGGSRKRAVAQLGISERTLRYKLQQYREEGLFSG